MSRPNILSFLSLATACLADKSPFYSNAKYNDGDYGKYVTQTFVSSPEVKAPLVNFMKPFTNCDDGSYLFVAPRGGVADPTPMILDAMGSPVWVSTRKYGQVYNLQVQRYNDQHYLTFWGGNDAVGGHGIGEYFMLDQQYNEKYRISAANNLGADLHAFTITPENTALISIYQSIAVDISSAAPDRGRGWIWDSIFQELDIETGEAVFEWRASTHIPITNSYTNVNVATEDNPWDVYHINSVEKDDLGNYLISLRFLRAIVYIDGKTGDVLWQLGGMSNSFQDLSSGTATSFMGQHDAHWHEGHRFITLFDNRADWYHEAEDQSKGTRVEVDLDEMTARLDVTFTDPYFKILSTSQGSYQTLPNGNVVLGYGFNAVMAEFSPDGDLLCDAYFQPASTFTSGDVQSYRSLKFNWTAYPDTEPSLVLHEMKLHMSWNGATEVMTWLLLGSDTYHEFDEGTVTTKHRQISRSTTDAVLIGKEGFETVYQVNKDHGLRQFVRVIALDCDGLPLGTSNIVDLRDLATMNISEADDDNDEDEGNENTHEGDHTYLEKDIEDLQVLVGFGILAILSAILIGFFTVGRQRFLLSWRNAKFTSPIKSLREEGRLSVILQRLRNFITRSSTKYEFSDILAKEGLLPRHDLVGAEEGRGRGGTCRHPIPEVQLNGMANGIIAKGDGGQ